MSEIQNAIEVKNLKKGFGGRVLFENFSLNVKANTIHAIIGPNGSGKTTLLRLITAVSYTHLSFFILSAKDVRTSFADKIKKDHPQTVRVSVLL